MTALTANDCFQTVLEILNDTLFDGRPFPILSKKFHFFFTNVVHFLTSLLNFLIIMAIFSTLYPRENKFLERFEIVFCDLLSMFHASYIRQQEVTSQICYGVTSCRRTLSKIAMMPLPVEERLAKWISDQESVIIEL